MPPLRSFIPFFTCFVLISCALFISTATDRNHYAEAGQSHESHYPLRALFAFHGPSALFAPAAIISLTDDNSTFFNARPAAFGPRLPDHGLSGPVWVGRRPISDTPVEPGSLDSEGGELGCSDAFKEHHKGLFDAKVEWTNIEPPDLGIAGKVALLSRGECGFMEKVLWAQRRGAVAVIVGDNLRGGPLVTMYAKGDTSNVTIPSIFTSHMTAHLLSSLVPQVYGLKPLKRQAEDVDSEEHEGLWVTLSTTGISTNPFFNTLFVLVVSPLITLAVVYVMLLARARIRRRRWRAPKSVVDRLPVRIYRALSSRASPSIAASTPTQAVTATTPLLIDQQGTTNAASHPTSHQSEISESQQSMPSSSYGSVSRRSESEEKPPQKAPEPRRRYNQKQVECSVCLEEYEDGVSRVMSLPCGHDFHAECVTPWLTTKRRTCPICKGDVVRSLGELEGTLASRTNPRAAGSTETQAQVAETVNESPSTLLPVSVDRDDVEDLDLEQGAHSRSS